MWLLQIRVHSFLCEGECKLKFFIGKYVLTLIFMGFCVKNEHFNFVELDALTQWWTLLHITIFFLLKIGHWPFPSFLIHLLNAHVLNAQMMAHVVRKILMQSGVVRIFYYGFVVWERRKVTLRMSDTCRLVVEVRLIFSSNWLDHWIFFISVLAFNFFQLRSVSVMLLVRHGWLNSYCLFTWWSRRVTFVISLGSSEGFRPRFSEIHCIQSRVVVLVFDCFGKFFFMILEFHLQSDFDILRFRHLDLRNSFEFFKVEKKSPLFIFWCLLAKFLKFLLIIEKQLLMFGLFWLNSFYRSLPNIHKFRKLSFDID